MVLFASIFLVNFGGETKKTKKKQANYSKRLLI